MDAGSTSKIKPLLLMGEEKLHPLWRLGMPAIMKRFFDRAFLPDLVFKSNKEGPTEGLLIGKTGRISTTAGDLSLAV